MEGEGTSQGSGMEEVGNQLSGCFSSTCHVADLFPTCIRSQGLHRSPGKPGSGMRKDIPPQHPFLFSHHQVFGQYVFSSPNEFLFAKCHRGWGESPFCTALSVSHCVIQSDLTLHVFCVPCCISLPIRLFSICCLFFFSIGVATLIGKEGKLDVCIDFKLFPTTDGFLHLLSLHF